MGGFILQLIFFKAFLCANDIPLAQNKKGGELENFMVYGVNLNVTNPRGVKNNENEFGNLCV
jgi:hypothetical protein